MCFCSAGYSTVIYKAELMIHLKILNWTLHWNGKNIRISFIVCGENLFVLHAVGRNDLICPDPEQIYMETIWGPRVSVVMDPWSKGHAVDVTKWWETSIKSHC